MKSMIRIFLLVLMATAPLMAEELETPAIAPKSEQTSENNEQNADQLLVNDEDKEAPVDPNEALASYQRRCRRCGRGNQSAAK